MFRSAVLLIALPLAACVSNTAGPPPTEVEIIRNPTGQCFARDISPASVVVVPQEELVQPEIRGADGRVIQPAIYRRFDAPQIAAKRDAVLFEAVCVERLTPEFTASVQRALEARNFYNGTITARMDTATRLAVLRYQRRRFSQDSDVLSVDTAREIGLIPVVLESN